MRVGDPVAGGDVLVVDDTWVSGGSAQSAAAALKLAGARRVAVVVLGRHVNPADPRSAAFLAAAAALDGAARSPVGPVRDQARESRHKTPACCPPAPGAFVMVARQWH